MTNFIRSIKIFVFSSALLLNGFESGESAFKMSVPMRFQYNPSGGCQNPQLLFWSNPQTWGGRVPGPNQDVFIDTCQVVILDVNTPSLGRVRINGALLFDPRQDIELTAYNVMVMDGGLLQIGLPDLLQERKATITLTAPRGDHQTRQEDRGFENDVDRRALLVMDGGTLHLYGKTPSRLRTKLNDHARVNDTSFVLEHPVHWKRGDRIAISMTDYYGLGGETEILTLAQDTNGATTLRTDENLRYPRWGKMQYPTNTGMSLTPGTFDAPSPNTPREVDERATIVNLTRNIAIQGANDDDWRNRGFGAHVMVMGHRAKAVVIGTEFRRVGQERAMARYPFHWHMGSYTSANSSGVGGGDYLGDVQGYLGDSAIWDSSNRAVTIHGTCGVTVSNVFAVGVKGHAFFLEDGVEERNTITRSVAMKVRPGEIKENDALASGFWLTNPNNTITFNMASDCVGHGLWNSFDDRPKGLSRNARVEPRFIPFRVFDDNTGHSNGQFGANTSDVAVDEYGRTAAKRYLERYTGGQVHEFWMRRNKFWKNLAGGYVNRVMLARYEDWTMADNNKSDFQGSTLRGNNTTRGASLSNLLAVGKSLNRQNPPPDPRRNAFRSYHRELIFENITAIEYPFHPPTILPNGEAVYGGGVFNASDMYVYSIDLGDRLNTPWKLINSHPGYLTPAPYFDGYPMEYPAGSGHYRYYSLPVMWDPHGRWGPSGNYLLPSRDAYYTHGLSSFVEIPPSGQNGISTPDTFYGISHFVVDEAGREYHNGGHILEMRCSRLDNSNNEVGVHVLGNPRDGHFFNNMRHFTVAGPGRHGVARYKVTFPGRSHPSYSMSVAISNAYRANDRVLVGIPWRGWQAIGKIRLDAGVELNISEQDRINNGWTRIISNRGNNINDVLNDASGRTYFQDDQANTVWVQMVGGLNFPQWYSGDHDLGLAKPMVLRIWRP